MTEPYALELNHISARTGETLALDDITLAVLSGEIHVLLGDLGGPGRTILFKILAGTLPTAVYTGEIRVAGQPVSLHSPQDAIRHGISIVPRRSGIFSRMTIAENITLGRWQQGGHGFLLRRGAMEQEALAILAQLDLKLDPTVPAGRLTAGQQRLVMIARALATGPKVVILDEPAASLPSAGEQSQLIRGVRHLAERNIGCLYLTRRPAEAALIADRVTVLRDGSLNGSWCRIELDELKLTQAMISQRISDGNYDEPEEVEEPKSLLDSLRTLFSGYRD